MPTIIDDAMVVLDELGFISTKVLTQPGYSGFISKAENGVSAYFVWSHSNSDDFQFRVARFWFGEDEATGLIDHTLTSAVGRAKSLLAPQ